MTPRHLLVAAAALAAPLFTETCPAAIVVLSENFDYADQAALTAVWDAGADNPDYALDTTVGNPPPSYAMPSPSDNFQGRLARNLHGGPVQATDAEPLVMRVEMLLDPAGAPAWDGARHYVELRGYENGAFGDGALLNLVALGVNNDSDNTFDTTYYQGRVVGGVDWQTLNGEPDAPNRATGWQELQVTVTGSEIRFSIGGVLAHVVPRPNNFPFDSVVLGADLTANSHDAWVDKLEVIIIPEPAAMALMGLAALGAMGIRRRKEVFVERCAGALRRG